MCVRDVRLCRDVNIKYPLYRDTNDEMFTRSFTPQNVRIRNNPKTFFAKDAFINRSCVATQ